MQVACPKSQDWNDDLSVISSEVDLGHHFQEKGRGAGALSSRSRFWEAELPSSVCLHSGWGSWSSHMPGSLLNWPRAAPSDGKSAPAAWPGQTEPLMSHRKHSGRQGRFDVGPARVCSSLPGQSLVGLSLCSPWWPRVSVRWHCFRCSLISSRLSGVCWMAGPVRATVDEALSTAGPPQCCSHGVYVRGMSPNKEETVRGLTSAHTPLGIPVSKIVLAASYVKEAITTSKKIQVVWLP